MKGSQDPGQRKKQAKCRCLYSRQVSGERSPTENHKSTWSANRLCVKASRHRQSYHEEY